MDSMRSLNKSLPRTPRKKRRSRTPEQLIQAFKNAALSVTNLYRTAEADENRAKQVGYQEAIDDLLTFLDRENIGLDDGEGWRIREWATEHFDDRIGTRASSESDEERPGAGKQAGSMSPNNHQRLAKDSGNPQQAPGPPLPVQEPPSSTPQGIREAQPTIPTSAPSQETFTFRTPNPAPQDADMSSDTPTANPSHSAPPIQAQATPSFTLNVLPPGSRPPRGSRCPQRSSSTRNLGSGAGSKRRIPFGDYFDISSLDGSGGGNKRGRMT